MEEWKEYKLGEICEILDSKRIPLSSMQRQNRQGNYPYYGAQGIIDYIDDYLFDGTYLLVAEDGNNVLAQKENIAIIAKGKFWVNNHAHILGYNGKCDLYLLGYILNSMDISSYVTGTAQPKLNQQNLSNIPIILPSKDKQSKIVSILKSLDDKIENNRKINENLEQQAQALFKSWFVDFEPFRGQPFVESELGMIPEGWRVGTLGELSNISSGKRPPLRSAQITTSSNIPLLGAADLMGYTNSYLFDKPILVTGRVGTHGIIQRWSTPCWPSDNTLVIESDYYEYIFQILKRIDYKNLNRGSTQPLITQSDLRNQTILIPKELEILKFEELVGTLMKKFKENNDETLRLSLLRDTLLPKLMSGEIKL